MTAYAGTSGLDDLPIQADRERIGRDLHDSVVQRLFATGLAMQGTASLAQRPEVIERLQQHIDDIDDTIREIRSVIFALEIDHMSRSSLRRQVLDLAAHSARVLGFPPAVHLDGPIDAAVPDDVATQLLPVLREALSNVARHAGAAHVDVTIRADHALTLEVVDDGTGGSVRRGRGGNGLRNMMDRAEHLGGHARIGPGPTGGTVVQWVVPLRAAEPAVAGQGRRRSGAPGSDVEPVVLPAAANRDPPCRKRQPASSQT